MSACPSGLSVILSIRPGTRKLRPLEARKRAERPKARRRVFVRARIRLVSEGCQTGLWDRVRAREAWPSPAVGGHVGGHPVRPRTTRARRGRGARRTPGRGAGRLSEARQRSATRAERDTPLGYARIALRRRRGPVYCSRASGAGTPRENLRGEPAGRSEHRQGVVVSNATGVPFCLAVRGRRYPSQLIDKEHDRTYGREAGLARGTR
jgi:hypothetical protein